MGLRWRWANRSLNCEQDTFFALTFFVISDNASFSVTGDFPVLLLRPIVLLSYEVDAVPTSAFELMARFSSR